MFAVTEDPELNKDKTRRNTARPGVISFMRLFATANESNLNLILT